MIFKTKKQLFEWIWDNRPHCSELSGEPLLSKSHDLWHFQLMHILPSRSWPAYKLREDNIILGTVDEHTNQESNPKFKELYNQKKRQYYKEIYGKEFD